MLFRSIRKKLLFESAQGIHAGIIKNKIKNWRALSKKPFLIILTLSGSTKGPYTIIDGHHRLIAMLLKKRKTPRLNTILVVVKENQSRTELRKLVGK